MLGNYVPQALIIYLLQKLTPCLRPHLKTIDSFVHLSNLLLGVLVSRRQLRILAS